MVIHVSVQYNGGLLPGIILLPQCYYHRGTRLNAMKRFCIFCSLRSHVNVLTFFPLTGGCSEGLGAFIFFFKQLLYVTKLSNICFHIQMYTSVDIRYCKFGVLHINDL